jgi:hypothetical protein
MKIYNKGAWSKIPLALIEDGIKIIEFAAQSVRGAVKFR